MNRRRLTWGLFAAWLLHDLEELATIPRWIAHARPRLERRFPSVPPVVWRRLSPSQEHAALAIGFMGCLIAAAAHRGARTAGRSWLYQAVLTGFGFHVIPHVASAAVSGGYTPGLVTAPTVVLPYSLWATRELRRVGVAPAAVPTTAYAAIPCAIGAAHLAAAVTIRVVARKPGSR